MTMCLRIDQLIVVRKLWLPPIVAGRACAGRGLALRASQSALASMSVATR
jgi:hypothetical protein